MDVLFFFVNVVGVVIALLLMRSIWIHRNLPMAIPLGLFSLFILRVCILNIVDVSPHFDVSTTFFKKVAFIPGILIPFLWFWISYEYIYRVRLPIKTLCLLLIEPSIMCFFYYTNHLHGLFQTNTVNVTLVHDEVSYLRMAHILYSLSLIAISLFLLIGHLLQDKKYRVLHVSLLLIALGLPLLSFLLYRFGYIPIRLGAPLSTLLVFLGVTRFKVFEIIPIAKEHLAEYLDDGIAVLNTKGLLVSANASATKLLELPLDKKGGIQVPVSVSLKLSDGFDFDATHTQKKLMQFSVINSLVEFAEVQLYPLFDKRKELLGQLLFIRDVTALKKLEGKREKYIHTIEHSHEQLQELDRLKTDFFANISHELRTPLTLSLGPLNDILAGLHGPITRDVQQTLEQSRTQNERLLHLVNQLLDLSRLEAGIKQQNKEWVNLHTYIPKVLAEFDALAQKKQVDLNFQTETTVATVLIDSDALQKILYNLLSNAFKNTQATDHITVQLTLADTECIKISITDTGRGISPTLLPHIFDRFVQGEHQQAHWQASTGIGLALVQQLLDANGGSISVTSAPDEGSCFTLTLPCKYNDTNVDDKSAVTLSRLFIDDEITTSQVSAANTALDINSNKPILLVIDDNQAMRAYIRFHLADDYQVLESSNGESGLDLAQQCIPDLVVSDIMMPKMDGYELCQKLKEDPNTCHIPILLLSAKSTQQDKLDGLATHTDDYLTKPFDRHELRARINNLIIQRAQLRDYYSRFFAQARTQTNIPPASANGAGLGLNESFLEKLHKYISEDIDKIELPIATLADKMHTSERQLQRKLKALTGQTPSQLIVDLRLQKATELLKQTELSVTQIGSMVGFNSSSYFAKKFKIAYQQSPREYRESLQETC